MSLPALSPMPQDPRSPRLDRRRLIWAGAMVLGLLLIRLIHLGADTPVLITLPDDVGLWVDEGYKTMGPRNLLLFGADSWYAADNYGSWRGASPLTQWPYYGAFRWLAPNLESARVVTLCYFGLFLLGYVWAMHRRLLWPVFVAGLLAIGLESTLFFYSRAALFEIPMVTLLYGSLFCFARMDERRFVLPVALTAVCGAFVALTIKVSAVLYLVPLGVALLIHLLVQTRSGPNRRLIRGVVLASVIAALVFLVAAHDWIDATLIQVNIEQSSHPFSVAGALYRTLTMPLLRASPVAVIIALVALAHGLATRPDYYLGNLYRLSLICLAVLAPVLVAVFPYNPLRYYVPVLPAYLLLALEWANQQPWSADVPGRVPPLRRVAVVALLAIAAFTALYMSYRFFPELLPANLRSRADVVAYVLLPAAAALGALAWAARGLLFHRRMLALGGAVGLLAFALYSAYGLARFLVAPTYQLRAVRDNVARIVGENATIAGDWAPMIVLGTPVRALYMNRRFNPVASIGVSRPDYFLHGESRESQRSLEELLRAPGVRVGAPIDVGTYYEAGWRMVLYPLRYDAPAAP